MKCNYPNTRSVLIAARAAEWGRAAAKALLYSVTLVDGGIQVTRKNIEPNYKASIYP